MKPLVIYHDNCADGFGAAFAAWLKLGDEAEYWSVQYGKDNPISEPLRAVSDREIYILDFSFPIQIMDMLFEKAKRVVWLDHHKTAFEMRCGKYEREMVYSSGLPDQLDQHYTHLNDNKSGALLAWEYFHPGTEVPMLIKHIDDYDRWQFKLDGTKEFNKALWSYQPWNFDQWRTLLGQDFTHGARIVTEMRREGVTILRAHEQNVQSVVKSMARNCIIPVLRPDDRINALSGLAANCPPHLTSDVGHTLATQSGTYGLLWYINKKSKCLCSLRSNGSYDVSAIARSFGGGGHRNAAGFEVDIQTLLEWLK